MFSTTYKKFLLLAFSILLLKLSVLGLYNLHHPSESRYASISMRMALSDNYLMPYFTPDVPFFGKPPFSFWASAVFFKLFGYSEFAGRLPHFFALSLVCFLVFFASKKLYNLETAMVSAISLLASLIFYVLQSIMTDAFLLLGMTITTISFILQIEDKKPKSIFGYLFFIGCAISVMTKGPVGLIMTGLPIFIYLIISKRWYEFFTKFPIMIGTILFLLLSLPWFILAEKRYSGFLEYFLIGENFNRFANSGWQGDRYGSAHKAPFAMIWLFFIASTIPVTFTIFFKPKKIFNSLIVDLRNKNQVSLFMMISFLVPMIILTFMQNMIGTYVIYSLVPFIIIISRLISLNNWQEKTINLIASLTIFINLVLLILFLIKPPFLVEKINYQAFLIDSIKSDLSKGSPLYYIRFDNPRRDLFSFYYYSRDNLKILSKANEINQFFNQIKKTNDQKIFLVISDKDYKKLNKKQKSSLSSEISCIKKDQWCLYQTK
jgi:4-amino-4-deoxy-L-arabinose transferase-like glycosyltransferase